MRGGLVLNRHSAAATFLLFSLLAASCNSSHKSPPAPSAPASAAAATAFSLDHSEWQLVELAGASIVPNSAPTLSFFEPGKVAGNASCNRFTGTVTINAHDLKFGPLVTTMMTCPDTKVGQQESTYLKALQSVTRYEWHDPYLVVFSDGFEKPLQFTRARTPGQ